MDETGRVQMFGDLVCCVDLKLDNIWTFSYSLSSIVYNFKPQEQFNQGN